MLAAFRIMLPAVRKAEGLDLLKHFTAAGSLQLTSPGDGPPVPWCLLLKERVPEDIADSREMYRMHPVVLQISCFFHGKIRTSQGTAHL